MLNASKEQYLARNSRPSVVLTSIPQIWMKTILTCRISFAYSKVPFSICLYTEAWMYRREMSRMLPSGGKLMSWRSSQAIAAAFWAQNKESRRCRSMKYSRSNCFPCNTYFRCNKSWRCTKQNCLKIIVWYDFFRNFVRLFYQQNMFETRRN